MAEHIIFRTQNGGFYGVSDRVMNSGYIPADGVLLATDEEVEEFNRRRNAASLLTKAERIEAAQRALNSNLMTEEAFQKIIESIPEDSEPEVEAPEQEVSEPKARAVSSPKIKSKQVFKKPVKKVNPFLVKLIEHRKANEKEEL